MQQQRIRSLETAIRRDPQDPEPRYDLGNLLLSMHRVQPALMQFEAALRLAPGHPQILLQIGNALSALGKFEPAARRFREALRADPHQAAAHYNLGNALRELGQPESAAASYRAALELTPQDADCWNNLGNVLREQGQLDPAIGCYREALRLNPNLHHARMHLLHQRMHVCDWAGLDGEIAAIREIVRSQPQAQISPFAFLALPGTTPGEQRLCAEHWARNRYAAPEQPPLPARARAPDPARLRVGYLSADFRQHPLTWLAAGLIEQHDRGAFEIHGYSYGPDDGSVERRRWESAFDVFHDIRAGSLQESAAQIAADGIDILVDLTGFTQSSRSGILALRPAPLQVNWLGFPGTMGAPFVDYLISDAWITPPETAAYYSEQLLLMPHTYQPNGARPEAAAPTRAGCGLPEAGVVFCCFNQTFKITPQVFQAWMTVLSATPGSVLWLLECNRRARENLLDQAARHGIAAERLIFAPRCDIAGHLARQQCADLFLDTAPYNAHTTASDALWAGLPVLTLRGGSFASRVAGSLLHAAGLPELIADGLDDYVSRAIRLAGDPQALSGLRRRLQHGRERLPLFDTAQFARDLERGYREMWRRHRSGAPPARIAVADL